MVVEFATTYVIGAYNHYRCEFESHSGEVYSIQHYVIKFISDLCKVGGFRRLFQFHPPLKLGVKHHKPTPYIRGTPYRDKTKNISLSIKSFGANVF